MTDYLHRCIVPPQKHANLQAYRFKSGQKGSYAICSNGNYIQVHKLVLDGLALQMRYTFFANIAKVLVLPSRHHQSDYLWILDELRRYACWNNDPNLQSVSNFITADAHGSSWASDVIDEIQRPVMAGETHAFEDSDTVGTIFFTSGNMITFLEYVINKDGVFLSQPASQDFLSGFEIRYVDWVYTTQNQPLLGVIQEQTDQSTTICCYEIKKGWPFIPEAISWRFFKKNLLHFNSQRNGDILITTYDEIALHKYKLDQPLKCYRTKGTYGQGFALGDGFYGHIGKQLVVFSRDELRSYNQFKLKDQHLFEAGGLIEGRFLGQLQSGKHVVGLITHKRQMIVLNITAQSCKMNVYSSGAQPICAFKTIEKHPGKFIVVTKEKNTGHQVVLIEHLPLLKTIHSQELPFTWDTLYATVGGNYLLVGSGIFNFVMRLTRSQCNQYQFYFQLPSGSILGAKGNIMVMDSGLYQLDYQSQSYQVVTKGVFLLGQIIDEDAYFLDSQGSLYVWKGESQQLQTVETGCSGDYCWGNFSSFLLCASLSNPSTLRILEHNVVRSVPIKGHCLVTSLSSISSPKRQNYMGYDELIVVGYADGSIHLHRHDGQLVYMFSMLAHNNVTLITISPQKRLVLCGNKQSILEYQQSKVTLKEVAVSHQATHIYAAVYAKKSNSLFYLHNYPNAILNQVQFSSDAYHPLITSQQTTLITTETQPKVLTTHNLVIAACEQMLETFHLKTKKSSVIPHQLHKVMGFEESAQGIILLGIDRLQQPTLVVLSQQLNTIAVLHPLVQRPLGLFISTDNSIFIASQQHITRHRLSIHNGTSKLLSGIQLQVFPQQVSLHPHLPLLVINDEHQHFSLFYFSDTVFELKMKQLPACPLTAVSLFEDVCVLGNERGQLTLLDVQGHQALYKRVGQINVGQRVVAFAQSRDKQILYYITHHWEISSLKAIEKNITLQEMSFPSKDERSTIFSYSQWRKKGLPDRIVDGAYLKSMLTKDMTSEQRQTLHWLLFSHEE